MSNKETSQEQTRHPVVDLKAGAHVMTLDAGVFCVFHAPGQVEAGPGGLPGLRISRAPGVAEEAVEVVTFAADGWMGAANSAALIRVRRGPAGVMVTTYQDAQAEGSAPRLQVIRLIGGVPAGGAASLPRAETQEGEGGDTVTGGAAVTGRDVVAHIQHQGDVGAAFGQWVGVAGSKRWIEGFSIQPADDIAAGDVEYQAVLGRGWLSPWVGGGQFCGSRGMSLPVLGLRVRLLGEAAERYAVRLTASFTDGTEHGPVEGEGDALQAESLAPLEAFRLEFVPLAAKGAGRGKARPAGRAAKADRAA